MRDNTLSSRTRFVSRRSTSARHVGQSFISASLTRDRCHPSLALSKVLIRLWVRAVASPLVPRPKGQGGSCTIADPALLSPLFGKSSAVAKDLTLWHSPKGRSIEIAPPERPHKAGRKLCVPCIARRSKLMHETRQQRTHAGPSPLAPQAEQGPRAISKTVVTQGPSPREREAGSGLPVDVSAACRVFSQSPSRTAQAYSI